MAFVKEIIETEEDKDLYNSFGFRDYQGKSLKLTKWTEWYIEKDKSLYLIGMGGGAFEIPVMYGLMTHQGIIVIQSHTSKLNIIERIAYQKDINLTIDEIKKMVMDALEALGNDKSHRKFKNADLSSMPMPVVMDSFEEEHYAINN